MKKLNSYNGVCFFNGLVFFAPAALLIRTQAGISEHAFFLLQALLSGIIFIGEVPTGFITDKIGYKTSLVLSQILLLLSRIFLFIGYEQKLLSAFVAEAVIEGITICFTSGTGNAYLYDLYGESGYMSKLTHSQNWETAGFVVSTISYAGIYAICGLRGLLATTIAANTAGIICSLFIPKTYKKRSLPTVYQSKLCIYNKTSLKFIMQLSLFSIAWLFVNFFYIDKLTELNLPPEWMTGIILLYSVVQMLAEPILNIVNNKFHRASNFNSAKNITSLFKLGTGFISGAFFITLGLIHVRWIVIFLMITIPLFITLQEFMVLEQQNIYIDELGQPQNRASILSVMNMGVNVVEIAALFASALLSRIGVSICFLMVGIFIAIFSFIPNYNSK